MRILVVEDDESVAKALKKVLTDENYAVDVANDGQVGWQLVSTFDFDLIVLDVVLPKLDGLQFCRRLREHSYNTPVLLVTALDSSSKKIAGLNAGADDYITKPFELEELLARVRVLLRRVQTSVLSMLEWGDLRLNPNSREVNYGEHYLNLTPKEYCLLELFLRNPSQVFSRGAILDNLWNSIEAPGEDTVTAHIKGLRRKLTDVGVPSDLIKTVYGVGYRLKPAEPSEVQLQSELSPLDTAPEIEPNIAAYQQQTRTALVSLWRSVKSQHLERLEILQQSTQALQNDCLTDDLRQAATRAAHSLTGALGVFGLRSGSDLARSIEQILRGSGPIRLHSQKQLSELVITLEEELGQALHQIEEPQSGSVSPLFVFIDNNLQLLRQLAKAIRDQGLHVQMALNEAALQELQPLLIAAQPASGKTNSPNTLDSEDSLPDVVLFNFSLADSDETVLKQLSQLVDQMPPLLVLVGSHDGSLASRIKATQLGSHFFLHNPDVSKMLGGILKLLSFRQQAANKILAVDDDPHILAALRALLEPKGLQLITLNQSLDFWTTLQASSPDLLLLDVDMPTFNGIELCRAVRQSPAWNRLPIIFFTAYGDAKTKAAALRAGANDVVEKSLVDSDLLTCLCDQLKQSQLQRAMAAIADGGRPG